MASVISRASQSYSPGTYTITRTIPANATVMRLKISLTDPGTWPVGRVADIRLIGPQGPAGGFSVDGGIVRDRQGNVRTVRSAEFSQSKLGVPAPFPSGEYTLEFDVLPFEVDPLKTVTSAVTVERF